MGKPKAQQTRKTLTLKEQVDVIKYKDKSGCGSLSLAEKVFVGKTQILSILKSRDKILRELETNEPSSKQRSARKTGNEETNKLIWKWFKEMSRRKLPISGLMLKERALQFAKDLGNTEFEDSNSWLDSFCKRSNKAFYVKSGEKADVDIGELLKIGKRNFQPLEKAINHVIYLTWMKQASFFVQLRTKLCIEKVKNALVVRKQRCD